MWGVTREYTIVTKEIDNEFTSKCKPKEQYKWRQQSRERISRQPQMTMSTPDIVRKNSSSNESLTVQKIQQNNTFKFIRTSYESKPVKMNKKMSKNQERTRELDASSKNIQDGSGQP